MKNQIGVAPDETNQEIKTAIFGALLAAKFEDESFFTTMLTDKSTVIYPKTLLFQVLNYVPEKLTRGVISGISR